MAKHAFLQAPVDEAEGYDHGLYSPALGREDVGIFDRPLVPQMARNFSRCVFRRVAALNRGFLPARTPVLF